MIILSHGWCLSLERTYVSEDPEISLFVTSLWLCVFRRESLNIELVLVFRCGLFIALVPWGCCNRVLQTQWLKGIFSQSCGGQKSEIKAEEVPCFLWSLYGGTILPVSPESDVQELFGLCPCNSTLSLHFLHNFLHSVSVFCLLQRYSFQS